MDRDEVCNIYMQRIKSAINWMYIICEQSYWFFCEVCNAYVKFEYYENHKMQQEWYL